MKQPTIILVLHMVARNPLDLTLQETTEKAMDYLFVMVFFSIMNQKGVDYNLLQEK